MQALILAGGLGTRLRAIVSDRPKAMARIAGRPFLEYQLELLKRYLVVEVILCVSYLHEQIEEYFDIGERLGMTIKYVVEKMPLGTAGAIKNAEQYIRGPFLALNGDSFLDLDLTELMRFHEEQKAGGSGCLGTLSLTCIRDVRGYGSIRLDIEHTILTFQEKSEQSEPGYINGGLYVLEPNILEFIPASRVSSLEKDIFPSILDCGQRLCGYPAGGFFVDIGTPEGFHRFEEYIERGRHDHQK